MKHSLSRLSKLAAVLSAGGLVLASFCFPASPAVAQGRAGPYGPGAGLSITGAPWACGSNCPSNVPSGVNLYTLANRNGMKVDISNYGGVVQSIWVPNSKGRSVDVALGFPNLGDYVNDFENQPWPDIATGQSGDTYFGGIIGRYANRIANHSFTLTGTATTTCPTSTGSPPTVTYQLPENNNETTTLHGGPDSYNTKVWAATPITAKGYVALQLTYTDPNCYNGFPGTVYNTVTYSLDDANNLNIYYEATSTASTVVNFTNHTYFNLGGEGSGSVLGQDLQINANTYTPTDQYQIPTGTFVPVTGTAFDFLHMHPIGEYIHDTNLPDGSNQPYPQLVIAHGYDHNWALNGYPSDCDATVSCLSAYKLDATAFDPKTGIVLRELTDQPGVQLYTGNFLVGDLVGPSGHTYRQGDAFTLETQHFPNTPNEIGVAGWPSVVLTPSQEFQSCTTYQFGTEHPSFASSPVGSNYSATSSSICPEERAH